jgi:toxin YoeB
MRLSWYSDAWEDYLYWQAQDKKILKKINELIKDIERNEYTGIGKPEPLKEDLAGWWSRRINNADRLIYRIDGDFCIILQCKGHYQD